MGLVPRTLPAVPGADDDGDMRTSMRKVVAGVVVAAAVSFGAAGVAQADELIRVPNVTGMSVFGATERLSEAGFDNVIASSPDATGLVAGTTPRAGTLADEDTTVILLVPSD
ncbi:PASTA domain-containing protein [Rhodococcus sp. Eu-32]|nr:PASTA domain-containing protein [Rhodococcus sp. Eu-32]